MGGVGNGRETKGRQRKEHKKVERGERGRREGRGVYIGKGGEYREG